MRGLNLLVSDLIDTALREDIGTGDLSSLILPPDTCGEASIYAKERGVVCGLAVAQAVFERVEPSLAFVPLCADGEAVDKGKCVARLQGLLAGILQAERTALNFLQHMSGIATVTGRMVEAVSAAALPAGALMAGKEVKIVDTRKTLPGLRVLQKYAVRSGGGQNHRFGLYDAVMLKDNHLAAAGGVLPAVQRVRGKVGPMVKIEVECETLEQVREAVAAQADVIMLDNMDVGTMGEAVATIAGRALVEASGNITASNIAQVAGTGVDVISLGCLTHSVQALDFSLVIDTAKPSLQKMLRESTRKGSDANEGV